MEGPGLGAVVVSADVAVVGVTDELPGGVEVAGPLVVATGDAVESGAVELVADDEVSGGGATVTPGPVLVFVGPGTAGSTGGAVGVCVVELEAGALTAGSPLPQLLKSASTTHRVPLPLSCSIGAGRRDGSKHPFMLPVCRATADRSRGTLHVAGKPRDRAARSHGVHCAG